MGMDDDERRCALPGCDTVLEPAPGRPQRLYCTAAHRAAARQARRAAGQAAPSAGERAAAHLPWLAPPVRVEAPRQHRRVGRREAGQMRRCRMGPGGRHTLAVLGAAGVLAGGYALASIQVEVDGTPTAATPVSAPPVPARGEGGASTETWAQRASVALVSVNRQLDTLAYAEQEWTRLPESARAGHPDAPLAALAERRAILQRRQATLQSQLDAYRSLRERRRDLAVSEQHLATLQTALVDVPPAPRRNAEQDAAIAALDEQRDLRIRQRDAQRTEVESLEQGVAAAAAAPLPDDDASTEQVTNDVLAAAREDDDTPEEPDEGDMRLPQIVPGREEDDVRPRQETETSGPPDPRGPRHGGEEQDAAEDTSKSGRAGNAHARVPDGPDDEAIGKPDAEHSDAEQPEKHDKDIRIEKEQKSKQNNEERGDKQGEEKRRGDDDELERATTGLANAGRVVIQLVPGGRDAASDVDVSGSTDASDRSPHRTPTARFATTAAFTDTSEEESDETSSEKKAEQKKKSDKKTKKKSEKKKSEKKKAASTSSEKVSSESSSSEDTTAESDDEHDGRYEERSEEKAEKKADKRSDDNSDEDSDDKSDEESSDGDTSDD